MALVRLLIILSFFCGLAYGDVLSNLSTGLNPKFEKNYTISFSSTVMGTFHRPDSESQQLSNEFAISPSISLGQGYTAFASISGLKDMKGQREFNINDGVLGLSKKLRTFGDLTLSGKVVTVIPLSENSKKNQQLRTSVKFSPTLAYKAMKGLRIAYTPGVKVNFHKFKNAITGSSNTQYTLSNSAGVTYSLTENMSFAGSASYGRSYTYRGNTKDFYALSQSLTFRPTNNTDITLGHTIGGNALKANGIDTEIEIFNNRKSSVFAGFGYTY